MKDDNRTAKDGNDGWRLRPVARKTFDEELNPLIKRKVAAESNSILPMELVSRSRRAYLVKVVDQINKSYDGALYDCCAVMCRRLAETLIIEVYVHLNRDSEIKGADGHCLMLSPLRDFLMKDSTITLGRNSIKALADIKTLRD